jgi:hypothetical protein
MSIQRKSMLGLESEYFTINDEGKLVDQSDKLFEAVKGTHLEEYVRHEYSKAMFELASEPKRKIRDSAVAYVNNLSDVLEIAEKKNLLLCPLATHPTREIPKTRPKTWYDAIKVVLGKEEVIKSFGKVCGFHWHYTLPEGIIKRDTEMIKGLGRSKAREIFLQQWNFLVAIDPIGLTFCQSSPYWFGFNHGKDCRTLVWREMSTTGSHSLKGIYYYHPIFGALPDYEFTLEDLRVFADRKKTEWLKLLEQKEFPTNEIAGVPALKFMWGPLRVNKIGTFEYRGPDMNHPSIIFSVASLLRFALEAIEENEFRVLPSDIGISEPFTLEDDTIYVPPFARVKYYEYQGTIRGLESDDLFGYANKMFNLVCKISGRSKSKNLLKIKEMLNSRKTVSDEILDMVKKNGYDLKEELPEDFCNYIALYHSKKLHDDIDKTKKLLSKFSG